MKKISGYLRLMRPANVITSVADVLAGVAISGILSAGFFFEEYLLQVILLCFSTAFLYAGGIVFNDVFDAGLDRIERPERAIPSGLISEKGAGVLGALLLLLGIVLASVCGIIPAALAILISFFAIVYNKWGKHHVFFRSAKHGNMPRT